MTPRSPLGRALMRLLALVLALLTMQPAIALSQPLPPGANAAVDSARAVRGQALELSLITYGPGEDVWEKFGHDAIAVRDTLTGRNYAYNWGMFDFDQPNFIFHFLTGETKYWMEPFYTDSFNAVYVRQNRTIRVQRLALTSVERTALLEFLEWNSAEENKYYRYDYYRDNCATRVRDALDRVLKGRLRAVLDTGSTPNSWRSETERATSSDMLVYPGIELALGRDADKHLSRWTESFMPERLADAVDDLVLRNDEGLRYRLVDHDSVVSTSTRVPIPIDPPDRLAMAVLLGLAIAGIVAFLADSRFAFLRAVLVMIVALWYAVGGILGTALLLAGTVTKHAPYMGHNITLWQINPLLLIAAIIVPVSLARRVAGRTARVTCITVVMLSSVGALLQFIPSLAQHSGVVIAITLPVHVAIAAALLRIRNGGARRAASAVVPVRAA